jgi:hypothetical protein
MDCFFSNTSKRIFLFAILVTASLQMVICAELQTDSFSEDAIRTQKGLVYLNPKTNSFDKTPITLAQETSVDLVEKMLKQPSSTLPFEVLPEGTILITLDPNDAPVIHITDDAGEPHVRCHGVIRESKENMDVNNPAKNGGPID